MKNKDILIFGNFGNERELNGQTARTRTVTQSIEEKYKNYNIKKFDTGNMNLHKIISLIFSIIHSKRIVIMPAQRSLKYIVFLINILNASSKTVYVAIGGWLYDFCLNDKKIIKKLSRLKSILVQIESLRENLYYIGLKNVIVFPNYRKIENKNFEKIKSKSEIRLVFYSRVREDKGILIAINAIDQLKIPVQLDIFGPIDKSFKSIFDEIVKEKKFVNYCGVLNGPEIISTLSKYNYMLFPTYYEGEGFPGAVLESMIAGTPVIASNWKYNAEIIHNGKNGIILEENTSECLAKTLKKILDDKKLGESMMKYCIQEAKKYDEKNVIPILFGAIDLK